MSKVRVQCRQAKTLSKGRVETLPRGDRRRLRSSFKRAVHDEPRAGPGEHHGHWKKGQEASEVWSKLAEKRKEIRLG